MTHATTFDASALLVMLRCCTVKQGMTMLQANKVADEIDDEKAAEAAGSNESTTPSKVILLPSDILASRVEPLAVTCVSSNTLELTDRLRC